MSPERRSEKAAELDPAEQVLAIVAHELRSPVQTISGWAQLLKSGALELEQSVRAIESIMRCAEVQSRLIEDLLDHTRLRRGALQLRRELINMTLLLSLARDAILPVARSKRITVDVRPGDSPYYVLGDALRLGQVFGNLLTNAVKFSSSDSNIELSITHGAREVRVFVRDAGIGIRPEFLPHVFDRFRSDDEHRRRGIGLGLAIARDIVELHGGVIAADSGGVVNGSTFSVTLPCACAIGSAPRKMAVQP